MRYGFYSLAFIAAFGGRLWAQEISVEAGGSTTGVAVEAANFPPALPAPGTTQETLEQRVQRLEGELEQARSGAAQANESEATVAPEPAAVVDNSWRYRQHNGKWWYWLPSKRWVYWSNGAWVDYVPGTPIVVSTPSYGITSGYEYGYPYSTRYHSHYRPSVGLYIGGGYGYGYGHGHGGHNSHGHGHIGHGHGHGGHGGHGHGGHGHGGHGGGHGHH